MEPLTQAKPVGLSVLHEDAHLLVANKPAGLLTQGWVGGEPSLEDLVRAYLTSRGETSPFLGTIHRLDRPVSGVVAWAKTQKSARRISQQFAERTSHKEYRAIVTGPPLASPKETWEDWLAESISGAASCVQTVATEAGPRPLAKRALTLAHPWSPARLAEDLRGLILFPQTGRTHQLRVQASSRARPIVGDTLYGSGRSGMPGIMLHARSLTIRHPALNRQMTFEAPFPAWWFDIAAFEA